jgi:streptomycin 6-kinase
MLTLKIPEGALARLERRHGEAGRAWLDTVPALVARICREHQLTVHAQFDSYEAVVLDASSSRNGPVVLKLVGDPAYEVGAWLRNPMDLYDDPSPGRLLSRRFDIFCDVLGDDRERYQRWAFVQMGLAAIWLAEDDQRQWPRAVEFAEMLLRA